MLTTRSTDRLTGRRRPSTIGARRVMTIGVVLAALVVSTCTTVGVVTSDSFTPLAGPPQPLRVWTHCGIEAAEIDGQNFIIDIDNPPLLPPAPTWGDIAGDLQLPITRLIPLDSEYTWANPFEDGTYVAQSDGSVIFTGDGGLVQRFVPAPDDYQPPGCY